MGRKGDKQQKIEDLLPESGQQANDDQATEQPTKKQKRGGVNDDDNADGRVAGDQNANGDNEQPSSAKVERPAGDADNAAANPDSATNDQGAGQAAADRAKEAKGAQADQFSELPDNVAEQGKAFFLYKPKVTSAGADPSVSSLDDIQRMFVILQPGPPSGGKCRLMVIPKKKLPNPSKHERFYAVIEATAGTPADLTSGMTGNTYSTKTQGERTQPAARAAGEGPYVIATGGSRGGTHLAYKLEIPAEPGEAQKILGINKEGSFVLSAKNPDHKGQSSRGNNIPSAGPVPAYTEDQKQQFAGRSWISVTDTTLLDVAGTELLLVGAQDDPIDTGELGEGGELLDQLADEEKASNAAEQELREQLEPTAETSEQAAGNDAIPVDPAVTGNLS
eukprot:gene11346-11495_t